MRFHSITPLFRVTNTQGSFLWCHQVAKLFSIYCFAVVARYASTTRIFEITFYKVYYWMKKDKSIIC